ncbi:MAG: hypothetical protein N5P05_000491 [Chroococcopsis gigantea SAG 12.99]|jgi:hypothetical protein|nr:ATP-binding protein [Chlorogloea purpurea SAG 13.99]MDV2998885.1 hypothetical protein [Chroococcopsis gigantea SAG 12.99]
MPKFDFTKFHSSESDNWRDLIESPNGSYPENIYSLLDKFVYYPNETLKILVLAYGLCPSALSKRLPLLFLYGTSGTGKSTAGKFVAKVRGKHILSSSDTFASLRNYLDETKFIDELELNCILVWDDLDPSVLIEQPNVFRMLKVGYDRQTQWISISSQKAGTNIRFATFSPKIISTIHPVWTLPKLSELDRRSIVVAHNKPDKEIEVLDLDSFSFYGLPIAYEEFWGNELTCKMFLETRKRFIRKKFDWLGNDEKQLLGDLVATVAGLNYFETESKIYGWLEDYWVNHLLPIKNKSSLAFIELLQDYIKEHTMLEMKLQSFIPIDSKHLLDTAKKWSMDGKIETYVTPITLGDYMGKLGYKLTKNGWERLNNG